MDQDAVQRLCLAGLSVLPIPDVENIGDIFKDADQLVNKINSAQETLIYHNATTAHLDALIAHINAARDKALSDYLDVIKTLHPDDRTAAVKATCDYHDALNRNDTCLPGLITFFGDESGLLFFKMSSVFGTTAQRFLCEKIMYWAGTMDLLLEVFNIPSSVTCRPTGCTQQKQANSAIQPIHLRPTKAHFPSLVVEEGNNQMLLRMEKDWWLDNSPVGKPQGDVKIVTLVKVDRPAKRIVIEIWDRHHSQPLQTVTITPHPEESLSTDIPFQESRWVVEGAPMVIPFEPVFLRPKKGGETDLVINESTFVQMARRCWQYDVRST